MKFSRHSRSIAGLPKGAAGASLAWVMPVLVGVLTAVGQETRPPEAVKANSMWAFKPVRAVTIPTVRAGASVLTGVDAFVQEAIERHGVAVAGRASKATLLRRVTLDLTGLPPTPAEVEAFERDSSPDAWERVVDRLLASPRYGERSARQWLDLARYAESEGFKADETRPNVWRYRDYVVESFNADKPFDRFVQEQIAGDELWPGDATALVATGFNRHYPDESNARNLMQRRQEILNDITDTVASVFCGITLACARCHDHKYDPIPQTDYYRFQAFFANSAANDTLVLAPADEVERYRARLADWERQTQSVREEMERMEAPHREAILQDYIEKYPENIQVALKKPAAERTPFEHQMVAKAKLYLDPESHQYLAPSSACGGRMKKEEKARWVELKKQLDSFAPLHPGKLPRAAAVTDVGSEPPPTHLLGRGNWFSPKEEVRPGFFSALGLPDPEIVPVSLEASGRRVAGSDLPGTPLRLSSGRRSALARWLTEPSNPLVARVMVNRVWQQHFGRGLVGTPGDFGMKGEAPTHPELLDWLAGEFVRSGWSLKALHRMVLRSEVYQRASELSVAVGSGPGSEDTQNRWLGRYPRSRVEGEVIRDSSLYVSGKLNEERGGPSVFPEMPPGLETRGGWKVNTEPGAVDRRSVYVFVRRNTRYPMFESFDMPDTHETCSRRNITTSPVQALTLLNSRLTHDWAQSFAGRVAAEAGVEGDRPIEIAWKYAYGRAPTEAERVMALEFLRAQITLLEERVVKGEPIAVPTGVGNGPSRTRAAALVDLCHALLNSNEFVYRE